MAWKPFSEGLLLFSLLVLYAASGIGTLSVVCGVFAGLIGFELTLDVSERMARARRDKKEPRDG